MTIKYLCIHRTDMPGSLLNNLINSIVQIYAAPTLEYYYLAIYVDYRYRIVMGNDTPE